LLFRHRQALITSTAFWINHARQRPAAAWVRQCPSAIAAYDSPAYQAAL